jgi:hypothetical protein
MDTTTHWQSDAMKKALSETDPIARLISVFEVLHPILLSDPVHGFVDCPTLVLEAKTARKNHDQS